MPPKLNTLLDQHLSFHDLPIVGPVAAGTLRDYVAACQPPLASEQQVNRMMTRLATMMPSPKITAVEADERMALYRRALSVHALPDLHAAFEVILKKCRFFPTVAEIEEIIAPIRGRRTRRESTVRMLLLKHERQWTEPQAFLTVEEAKQLGSILADPMGKDEGAEA